LAGHAIADLRRRARNWSRRSSAPEPFPVEVAGGGEPPDRRRVRSRTTPHTGVGGVVAASTSSLCACEATPSAVAPPTTARTGRALAPGESDMDSRWVDQPRFAQPDPAWTAPTSMDSTRTTHLRGHNPFPSVTQSRLPDIPNRAPSTGGSTADGHVPCCRCAHGSGAPYPFVSTGTVGDGGWGGGRTGGFVLEDGQEWTNV
jgi:hypothetical protein